MHVFYNVQSQAEQGNKNLGKDAWTGSYTPVYRPSLAHNMFAGNYDVKMARQHLGYTGYKHFTSKLSDEWVLFFVKKCYLQVHNFSSRKVLNKLAPLTCITVLVEELKVSEIFASVLCWAIMLSIRCPQGLESHCGEFNFLFDKILFWSLGAELVRWTTGSDCINWRSHCNLCWVYLWNLKQHFLYKDHIWMWKGIDIHRNLYGWYPTSNLRNWLRVTELLCFTVNESSFLLETSICRITQVKP